MSERTRASALSPVSPAGNLSTGVLKWIALLFMIVDHCGKVFFNNLYEMRLLGRIAFPIYAWCMIVGLHRTRNVPRYLLRILVVGLISQPLYVLALDYELDLAKLIGETFTPLNSGFSLEALWKIFYTVFLQKPNIFLTLLIGLAALWGIREKKYYSQFWAPVLAVCLATLLKADYGWKGILFFILLYMARGSRPAIAAVMIGFFLFWGSAYQVPSSLFGIPVNLSGWPDFVAGPLKAFLRLEAFGLLAMPFILIRFPRDIHMPKWLGYSLYPAHLVLMVILKLALVH